jgi:hypothetical protein
MKKQLDPARILNAGFGFWTAKILLTAVDLGLSLCSPLNQ